MSSFFTVPGEQKKRKRAGAPDGPKKRIAASSGKTGSSARPVAAAGSKAGRSRDAAPSRPARKSGSSSSSKAAPARGKKKKSGGAAAAGDDDGHGADDGDNDDGSSIASSDSEEDGGRRRRGADDDDDEMADGDESSDGDEAETAAERRLRLAERYLENVRREVGGGGGGADTRGGAAAAGADGDIYAFDAEDVDRELIAARLLEDVAEAKGRVYRQLAGELGFAHAAHCLFRWNAQNVNGVAVCAPYAYTVSSDVYLTKWRLQDRPEQQRQQRAEARRAWEEAKRKKKKRGKKQRQQQAKAQQDARAGGEGGAGGEEGGDGEQADDGVPPRKRPERVLFRRGNPGRRRDKGYRGHVGAILCVAASQDGRFVVTGGADRRMVVWDAATLQPLRVFTHHRDAVTGLAFRRGTNQLYSCSKDRTIKVWSLDELAYVQTLFGHQDDVADIDALAQEKCVSVGARDRTARMWKVVEETQLVFRGGGSGGSRSAGSKTLDGAAPAPDPMSLAHEGSMDRVAMLDDELFVTGSDNGALALWSTQKKKPLFVVPRAHGIEPALANRAAYDAALAAPAAAAANPPPPPQPRWITALRTIPYSDVVLSGSWDGCVRVWRLSKDKRKLEAVGALGADVAGPPSSSSSSPIPGVVNDIAAFERGERGRDGLCVVVAVGKEHRLGRWGRTDGARNGAVVFEISRSLANGANGVNGVNGVTAE